MLIILHRAYKILDDHNRRDPQLHSCVDKSTICSTSSDQDPTLSSAVCKIRDIGTRRRRASVAVWSDPDLLAFAEQKSTEQPQVSNITCSRFAQSMYTEPEDI